MSHRPKWDEEQCEIIQADPIAWQLVIAGPGTGKSAVACQRIAYLIDQGVAPSRILLISFTRTAVAELRDRIVSFAVAGERARAVRLSTIDAHAWSLRAGCDSEPLPDCLQENSYEAGIARVIELFAAKNTALLDFIQQLEHLVVDEAQDVVGSRAQLIVQLLRSLSMACGVTILADPGQAIYGFTTDEDDCKTPSRPLLELLRSESPRPLTPRRLTKIHRVKDPALRTLFEQARQHVEREDLPGEAHLQRMRAAVRGPGGQDIGTVAYAGLAARLREAGDDSTLVLFRRRADALMASSYCAGEQVEHRLRLSEVPIVVYPWIGWLLQETAGQVLSRGLFDQAWDRQAARAREPFAGYARDTCWGMLHRVAAGPRPGSLDLAHLRALMARDRPPIELCLPDGGTRGPILGTIHASKGREANTVVLVLPSRDRQADSDPASLIEESRVCYVGATRARERLVVASAPAPLVSALPSGRVYRFPRGPRNRVQLEIGREGDADRVAHLMWSHATEIQTLLASCAGQMRPIAAHTQAQAGFVLRLVLQIPASDGGTRAVEIGELSPAFQHDLSAIWGIVDTQRTLKPPPRIERLHLVALTTIALTEEQRIAAQPPFAQSGFALAAVVRGFPTIPFFNRHT